MPETITSRLAVFLSFLVCALLHGESSSRSLDEAPLEPVTLHFTEGKNAPFDVKIVPPSEISWPGNNRQTVEVYKGGKRVSSQRVGGEPVMLDAWGAVDDRTGPKSSGSAYVYILCEHRRRAANAIYIYAIQENLTLKYCGLVFTKQELKKETEVD